MFKAKNISQKVSILNLKQNGLQIFIRF